MKAIKTDNPEELKKNVEKIAEEIEQSGLCEGPVSVERVEPPPGTPTNTPAGYPHVAVTAEQQKKFLGLIPYTKKKMIFAVKEGFYDIEENGQKDILVLVDSKKIEPVIKKHLEEYSQKNQVTKIVCKT